MITGSSESIKWTKHPNTYFDRGEPLGPSTLASCKTRCVDDSGCTGIVWNEKSSKCWLHGWWSSAVNTKFTAADGFHYYNLTRNGAGKCHASLDLICTVESKIFITNYQKKNENKRVTLFWIKSLTAMKYFRRAVLSSKASATQVRSGQVGSCLDFSAALFRKTMKGYESQTENRKSLLGAELSRVNIQETVKR